LCDTRKINVDETGVACDTYGNDENRIQFWLENVKENDSLDHLSIVWKTALKWILKVQVCTDFIWLRIGPSYGLLWKR